MTAGEGLVEGSGLDDTLVFKLGVRWGHDRQARRWTFLGGHWSFEPRSKGVQI